MSQTYAEQRCQTLRARFARRLRTQLRHLKKAQVRSDELYRDIKKYAKELHITPATSYAPCDDEMLDSIEDASNRIYELRQFLLEVTKDFEYPIGD